MHYKYNWDKSLQTLFDIMNCYSVLHEAVISKLSQMFELFIQSWYLNQANEFGEE